MTFPGYDIWGCLFHKPNCSPEISAGSSTSVEFDSKLAVHMVPSSAVSERGELFLTTFKEPEQKTSYNNILNQFDLINADLLPYLMATIFLLFLCNFKESMVQLIWELIQLILAKSNLSLPRSDSIRVSLYIAIFLFLALYTNKLETENIVNDSRKPVRKLADILTRENEGLRPVWIHHHFDRIYRELLKDRSFNPIYAQVSVLNYPNLYKINI